MDNKKNNKRKTIDTRIIQLGRWHVPRSQQINDNTMYLAMGYFDMIHVKDGNTNQNVHVFRDAYDNLMRNGAAVKGSVAKTIQEEYAFQELMIFTNVGTSGFSDTQIEKFWKKKNPLLFVSMIHIDNGSNIEEIIKKIKEIFEEKDFLYYFTFDYSGIIILTKEKNIGEYLKLLFELNYGKRDSNKKLIRDSYSFWGFEKEWISQYFDKFREFDKEKVKEKRIEYYKGVLDSFEQQEHFSVSMNIGVQNYEIYKKFQKRLEEISSVKMRREYGMLGRHDISVVIEDANLGWLVYMQYLLNELSIPETKDCYDDLISIHETFIKIENIGSYYDGESKKENHIYKYAKKDLDEICEKFTEEFQKQKEKYNGQYQHAIYAVRNSLLSILKNRYAEDFVLCVYQPFTEFVKYLTEKIQDSEDSVLMFNKCYKNFFECLNSLVNSAMHSERQFIQATAFNALIYDVPSKILAFYMALINDIKEIMSGEEDKDYTFILIPSFSNEIEVEVLSYPKEKQLPHNRILKVEINEKSLYNPPEVEECLVHEIGHFLGDDFRCREIRKERILFSVIYLALIKIFDAGLVNAYADRDKNADSFEKLANSILEKIKGLRAFSLENRYYSVDLYSLGKEIAMEFQENTQIKNMLANYIRDVLNLPEKSEELTRYLSDVVKKNTGSDEKITDSDILKEMIMWDIEEEMRYLNVERRGFLFYRGIKDESIVSKNQTEEVKELLLGMAVNIIIKMYYEAYADIQMVLITGMGYQEYLMGFFKEDSSWKLPTENNLEDIGRISMVSMVMQKCGMWEFVKTKNVPDNMKEELNKLHGKVISMIKKVESLMHDQENIFGVFQEKYKDYIQDMKWKLCEGEEKEAFAETVKEENIVDARICFELLRYLFNCVDKCIGVYSGEKKEKISNTRKVMRKVNACNDIQEVFVMISEKITKYSDTVFPKTDKQDIIEF